MATLVLAAAGSAIGGAFGGTAFGLSTAVIGRAIGATLGNVIDQRLMGGGSEVIETGRLERFRLTGASEGTPVNHVFGRMRLGGQVIWATRFKEHVKTTEQGGKGGGGGGAKTRQYSYSVNLAVALCEGEILRVGRVWADGMEIPREDLNMRVYAGTEDQQPDPKIEAVEGQGNAPAYRGIAYVVMEELHLAQFGNRVPQFSFEVIRATDSAVVPEEHRSLSETIRGVALIPGTGEYSLATTKVHFSNGFGWNQTSNVNSGSGMTDFETSLEHLTEELPRCESVSLVVSWFGDDLRCGDCSLRPKVEQSAFDGVRMPWKVSGLDRGTAETVARIDGRPVYGGTPADRSVIEAIAAMRDAGKAVMFYPFILMEQAADNQLPDPWSGGTGQAHLPWRGRITASLAPGLPGSPDGSAAARDEVLAFFGNAAPEDFTYGDGSVGYAGPTEWSYRRFILHYAHLCAAAGGVDAFCIGSEMRGLTQIRGQGNSFPAVAELKRLAGEVRQILGPGTKIGYGADWSEYFGYHPQDGSGDVFFHLDPLWADADIDFVGIDNYMPLSDWRDGSDHADADWGSIHSLDYLKANIEGGEGYDWYYADAAGRDAQDRLPITDGAHGEPWVYRYKDIRNWWRQPHHQRIGGVRQAQPTAWQPESKPIWFTELGCAAIDKGTNQPNKFLDPKSSESRIPWYSNGRQDDWIQAQYLRAMYQYWGDAANNPLSAFYGGRMIAMSRAHVWAWDARPYPAFPGLADLWSDGANYLRGHWLNGRTTSESLAAVVAEICARSGVTDHDVSGLHGNLRGYAIEEVAGARAALQPLILAYGFDAAESEGRLRFRSRTGRVDAALTEADLVETGEFPGAVECRRAATAETAGRVRLNYVQAGSEFENRAAEAVFPGEEDTGVSATDLALCLTAEESRRVTERWLSESRVARDSARFSLPPSRRGITAGDVVTLPGALEGERYRVDHVESGEALIVEAVRVEADVFQPGTDVPEPVVLKRQSPPMPVFPVFLDLPLLTGSEDPVAPHVAVTARPWPGEVAIYASAEDDGYVLNRLIEARATIGVTETALAAAAPGMIDRGAPLRVRLGTGSLSSAEESRLLNGANACAIGDMDGNIWEVFQFGAAELVGADTYALSHRLRGQLGTDALMPAEWPAGSLVVLLDGTPQQIDLAASARGLERHYRVGPAARPYDDDSYEHLVLKFAGAGLRPYAPVHLRAVRQAGGDLALSWIRRTRIDGDSWESYEVPLGEEAERYLVRVIAGGNVLRSQEVTAPAWTYAQAAQASDGVSSGYSIEVAQVSERFGPGPFRRIEIDE